MVRGRFLSNPNFGILGNGTGQTLYAGADATRIELVDTHDRSPHFMDVTFLSTSNGSNGVLSVQSLIGH